jgi:hypothetical protein
MFPMRTWTWSIVHSYGLAAVVGWFRSKLPTGRRWGYRCHSRHLDRGGTMRPFVPWSGCFSMVLLKFTQRASGLTVTGNPMLVSVRSTRHSFCPRW